MSLYPSVHDSYCISFTFYKLLVFFVFFYKYKSGLNCSAIEALLLRSTQVNQSRVILTRSNITKLQIRNKNALEEAHKSSIKSDT